MLSPVVERELRVALLRRKARQTWVMAACISGGVTFLFLLLLGVAYRKPTGRPLFLGLFGLGLWAVVTRAFSLTADLLSEERRNGTLGLLVLSGLRPIEIFAYKLLGAGILAAYGLLAGLPFFSISFLAGAVSGTEFICALVFLSNALLFCLAIGLLASAGHRDGGQAQISAFILAAMLCLAPVLGQWLSSQAGASSRDWMVLSPAYAPYLVIKGYAKSFAHQFWVDSAIMLGYSLAALSLAAMLLHRTWRDNPRDLSSGVGIKHRPRWLHRGRRWREWLRTRWLGERPFCWLAARDRAVANLALAWTILGACLWGLGWWTRGGAWLTAGNALLGALLLHVGLNMFLVYATGKGLGHERQSGGLEVLLTTPLSVEQIIAGQRLALIIQFRAAWVMVLYLGFVVFLRRHSDARVECGGPGEIHGALDSISVVLVRHAPGIDLEGHVDQPVDWPSRLCRSASDSFELMGSLHRLVALAWGSLQISATG